MGRRGSAALAGVSAVLLFAAAPGQAEATNVLRLNGVGPLKLGMTATAGRQTGWLADRALGCELAGPHRPVTYRLSGRRAPAGIRGTVEFDRGRLGVMSFTRGVRTTTGVRVGRTTTARMAARYRGAGFGVSARFDSVFQGTFVNVRRRGRQVIGGFSAGSTVTLLGIPAVPVCE